MEVFSVQFIFGFFSSVYKLLFNREKLSFLNVENRQTGRAKILSVLLIFDFTVYSFLDDAFRKNLESALRFGNPLLVQVNGIEQF